MFVKSLPYQAVFFCLLVLSTSCFAGELTLKNQNKLDGEVYAITADHLVWASSTFGNVNVPKDEVQSLYSAVPLKLVGFKDACYWLRIDYSDVFFQCPGAGIRRFSFRTLSDVQLLEGYASSTLGHKGKLVAVGTKSTGNKNQQDWLVDIDAEIRRGEYRHILGGDYDSELIEDNPPREKWELSYVFDWFFSPQMFWSLDNSVMSDEVREIDIRYTTGSGVGYQFWDSSKSALSLESGVLYISETLADNGERTEDELSNDYVSWRLSSVFSYQFPRSIALTMKADLLQSLNQSEEWEVVSEVGVSLPIALGISADMRLDYRFDNLPPEGLKKKDVTLRFGVSYQW